MHASDFDADVTALVRALEEAGVEHLLLEDEAPDTITVVPGPTGRNVDRLAAVLEGVGAMVRLAGRPAVVPFRARAMRRGGPARWTLRIAGADADVLVVDPVEGRYGRFLELSHRVELAPGVAAEVVPDEAVAPLRVDAIDAMPELARPWRERGPLRRSRTRRRLRAAPRPRPGASAARTPLAPSR